ncbi:MAG: TolC family protein [Kiritimatiellae bacterium]|nr:TolC family protein [Kiritimatiellia bacterium]
MTAVRKACWRRGILLGAVFALPLCAAGEDSPPARMDLSLGECVRLAVSNNLALRQKRLAAREALADALSARGAFDPALEASGAHSETSGGSAEGTDADETRTDAFSAGIGGLTPFHGLRWDLGLEMTSSSGGATSSGKDDTDGFLGLSLVQPLLKGLKTDSARHAARTAVLQAEQALCELDRQAQESLFAVEEAWIALIAARELVAVREEAERLASRLAEDNARKVAIGTMARLDERQAASQAASARAAAAAARQAEVAAQNALKSLVFASQRTMEAVEIVPPDAALAAEAPALDPTAARTALERRPDIRIARLAEEIQRAATDRARSDRLPQLDLSGRYGLAARNEDGYGEAWDALAEADRTEWRVGLDFSFPIGNRAARHALRSAELAGERLALATAAAEETALVEVADAANGIRAAWEAYAATEEAVDYAADALEAEQRKLEQGKSTSFVVLQLQKNLTDAKKERIDALAAYARQRAAYAKAQGLVLDRLGIVSPADAEP